jgi:hypothetical protein
MATATLGCGAYRVFVFERGKFEAGADASRYLYDTPYKELDFGSCRFSRILRQTTSATIELVDECWAQISDVVPLEHEIAIYRDNLRVWSGPITSIKGKSPNDPVTIEARDVSFWLGRRVVHRSHNYLSTDLAEIFSYLFDDAMISVDYTPGMKLSWSPISLLKDRNYPKNTKSSIMKLMDDLAAAGVPWYVNDRTIIAGGLVVGDTPVAYLTDRDFVESIDWEINGFELVNRMYAGTSGDGQNGPLQMGIVQSSTSISTYGLLEDFVENDASIETLSEAQIRAAKELIEVKTPIFTYSTSRLANDAEIEFSDLLPGNLVELTFPVVNFLYTNTLKIATIEVSFGPEHESINLGLIQMRDTEAADIQEPVISGQTAELAVTE